MVSQEEVDQAWAQLAETDSASREALMVARYVELAAMPEEQRRAKLRAMANAEYSLPDEKLRPFTVSRLRTWLSLDDETAPIIAHSYDAVMLDMPASAAMKRVSLVQTLVTEFSAEEEDRLRELVPRVFAGAPSRRTGLAAPGSAVPMEAVSSKKPWWAFWRRS